MFSNADLRGTPVLLVDDEPNVLSALRRAFQPDGYALQSCPDAASALACARRTEFALVLSDYRMPEVDGVTFLTLFRSLQPDAMRVIGDEASVIRLKRSLTAWFLEMFSLPVDEALQNAPTRTGVYFGVPAVFSENDE